MSGGRWFFVVLGLGTCALGCGAETIAGPRLGSVVCADDGGIPADSGLAASGSLVSGTFTSPDVIATICQGGVSAVLDGTVVAINNSPYGLPANRFRFEKPTDAVSGELAAYVEVGTVGPGLYQSTVGCGSIFFAALLPVPASIDCQAAPPAGMECPPGCALEGPISDVSCMPVMPEIDYQASGSANCGGSLPPDEGSFTLTLTSVTPNSAGTDVVHGSLTAQLVGGIAGAGLSTGSLSLAF